MSSLDRLYRDVENLKQQYKGLAGGPQLALSSIENGSIDSKDADGNLKMTIGEQDDGGNTINVLAGPTPPTPTGFTVDTDYGKLIIHWSGDFDGEALAPSDWSRAEVHASQDPYFVPSRATARGSIVSAAGGEVTIGVLKGPWTIKMLAWSQAGKMSAPSAPVDVDVPGYGDIVLEEIDAATTLIKNAGEMLLEGQQTLAEKLAGIADLDPEEISEEIAQARQEAIDAALAEIEAVSGDLTTKLGLKNETTWSTSNPPTTYSGTDGDTWIKLTSLGSGGREIGRWRWNGSVWVTHPVDGAILSNIDASTITTGFLDVLNRVRAGAILADKLLIGNTSNVLPNPSFSNNGEGWGSGLTIANGGKDGSLLAKTVSSNSTVGGYTGATAGGDKYHPQVVGGASYVASVWARSDVDIPVGKATIYMRAFKNDTISGNTYTWATPSNAGNTTVIPANTWTLVSRQFGMPEGAIEACMGLFSASGFTGVIEFCQPSLRPMADGTLITPGGVQTPHLAADVLEVGNLKAGTAALAEAVIKKLFAEVVVAQMVQATEFIGENAILTGAITAPKITASEELWAKLAQFVTVRAEMMDADVFIGRRFEGVDIAASRFTAGTAVEITENFGIRQFGPNGELNVSFPSDGSPASFAGDVRAKSLTATGRMAIEGPAVVASGGQIQVESGVTPPATPPNVSSYVKRTQFPALTETENAVGLAFDGTHFWRAVDNAVTGAPDRMERIDVGGNLVSSFEHSFWVRNGITIIGSEILALGIEEGANRDKSKRFVYVYDFTGAFTRKWEYRDYGTGTFQPCISSNGTDVFIAQCWSTGLMTWRRYNKTTGAMVQQFDSSDRFNSDISGMYVGPGGFGSTRVIAVRPSTGYATVYNGTAWVSTDSWYGQTGNGKGLVYANGRFHQLASNNDALVSYSTQTVGTDGDLNEWWIATTWSDGTNETPIGPPRRFTLMRRSGFTVTVGGRPTGVTRVRVYLARKTTEPARTEFVRIGEVSAGDSLIIQDLSSTWALGSNPPASNSFTDSTPGIIRSTLGGFEVKGDGSGKWGPLQFHADGTMTSSAVPAWVPVTTFKPGFSAGSFGFAPAYRVWPDGKVEWRGVVSGSFSGSPLFITLPAGTKPSTQVNVVQATNATSGGYMMRCEISSTGDPNAIIAYTGGVNRSWVSLDGLYYYVS